MTKQNRITYRFDRQGNKIEDSTPAHEEMQQSPVHRELAESIHKNEQKWSFDEPTNDKAARPYNEYELDIEKLERLIRESSAKSLEDHEQQAAELDQAEQKPQLEAFPADDTIIDTGYRMKQVEQKKVEMQTEWKGNEDFDHSYVMNDYEQQRLYELDRAEEGLSEQEHSSRANSAPIVESDDVFVEKRKSLPWLNSAISVISAIVTGVCIGYLLLSLVFGVSVWPLSALAQPNQTEHAENAFISEPSNASLSSSEQQEVKELAPETAIKLTEASFNYHVLQAGVFTQEKTRDEVIASLERAGLKGHYLQDSSDRYFVYAGVASSAINAAPIQGGIKGIETYRKEFSINLPTQIAYKGEAAQLEQYFADSNALIAMYADLVAAQLEQTSFSRIGQAAQDAWQADYESWLSLAEQVDMNWVEATDKEQALALKEQLMNAEKQLQSYQSEPKSASLWNVQSSLVKSVLIQKEWFE